MVLYTCHHYKSVKQRITSGGGCSIYARGTFFYLLCTGLILLLISIIISRCRLHVHICFVTLNTPFIPPCLFHCSNSLLRQTNTPAGFCCNAHTTPFYNKSFAVPGGCPADTPCFHSFHVSSSVFLFRPTIAFPTTIGFAIFTQTKGH